jgi:hypothetical protein
MPTPSLDDLAKREQKLKKVVAERAAALRKLREQEAAIAEADGASDEPQPKQKRVRSAEDQAVLVAHRRSARSLRRVQRKRRRLTVLAKKHAAKAGPESAESA